MVILHFGLELQFDKGHWVFGLEELWSGAIKMRRRPCYTHSGCLYILAKQVLHFRGGLGMAMGERERRREGDSLGL